MKIGPTPKIEYKLPPERAADRPINGDQEKKMLVYSRSDESLEHKMLNDLPEILRAGDVLVFNAADLSRTRIVGEPAYNGEKRVIQLLHDRTSRRGVSVWEAHISEDVRPGEKIHLPENVMAKIQYPVSDRKHNKPNGSKEKYRVQFSLPSSQFHAYVRRVGHMPIPFLTSEVLKKVRDRGVTIERVVLGQNESNSIHKRNSTRDIIKTDHAVISPEVASQITQTKREGGRVVAMGGSVIQALESSADKTGVVHPFDGDTSLFLTPDYEFRIVDALLTTFFLPRSPHLWPVAAMVGSVESMLIAYQEATENEYYFSSFGDLMFIK